MTDNHTTAAGRPTCQALHTTDAGQLLVCTRTHSHQGSHTDTQVAGQVRVWPAR